MKLITSLFHHLKCFANVHALQIWRSKSSNGTGNTCTCSTTISSMLTGLEILAAPPQYQAWKVKIALVLRDGHIHHGARLRVLKPWCRNTQEEKPRLLCPVSCVERSSCWIYSFQMFTSLQQISTNIVCTVGSVVFRCFSTDGSCVRFVSSACLSSFTHLMKFTFGIQQVMLAADVLHCLCQTLSFVGVNCDRWILQLELGCVLARDALSLPNW